MTSGATPPAAIPSQAESSATQAPSTRINIPVNRASVAESSVFSPSSPVQSRSHPFLRKFQSGSPGSSAFSTSTGAGSSGDSSDNGRKSVDEAISAVAAKTGGNKSPTVAAANAADAVINRRLSHLSLNDKYEEGAAAKKSADHGTHTHGHDGCCDGKHVYEFISDDEDVFHMDSPNIPPISAEARRFSEQLLGQNKAWAIKTEQERPGFFAKLEKQQKPQVLWIGCSDSRVPANQIVNLDPGEIFVHRNIANVVTHTDMNLLSVLEYAVEVLKVRHIIICGHYGCGGVAASLTQKQFGIIDNWLRNIKDLYTIHRKKFEALPHGGKEQQDLLTELNVIQSALNVCHTSIIQRAWSRGEELSIHGWCYRLSDGMIRNLGLCIEGPGNVEDVYHVQENLQSKK
ncbi:hypothetical protein BGZ58_007748 [Dissophora ornata]|nr:hypothetical protein BGZ58_007748 [Dissophora ornata]